MELKLFLGKKSPVLFFSEKEGKKQNFPQRSKSVGHKLILEIKKYGTYLWPCSGIIRGVPKNGKKWPGGFLFL